MDYLSWVKREKSKEDHLKKASNTIGGACALTSSLCNIKNPDSLLLSSLSSLPPTSPPPSPPHFLPPAAPQSGSVTSPSMLSPASRGPRNARVVFLSLSRSPLPSHMIPLRITHSHCTCMCVSSHGCVAPR